MVTGLVIQTRATEIGKFEPITIAPADASAIWNGTGIQAQNNPTEKAIETE